MTPTVFVMCVLLYLAARWPDKFLRVIIMLDLQIRLFWLDCQIAWVTFWLILKLRRAGLNVPLTWGTIWPSPDNLEE